MASMSRGLLTVVGAICALMLALPVGAQEPVQETGTDPRDFAPKFMPYYRKTELKNGVETQALTAFGLVAFTPKFAMTYEIPLGYKLDVTETSINNGDNTCGPGGSFAPGEGLPPIEIPGVQGNCQETGMGDMNLRFMYSSDVQIWIASEGRPLPGKLVISSKWEGGSPRFVAFFKWDTDPAFEPDLFTFDPPDGAVRIEFLSDLQQ